MVTVSNPMKSGFGSPISAGRCSNSNFLVYGSFWCIRYAGVLYGGSKTKFLSVLVHLPLPGRCRILRYTYQDPTTSQLSHCTTTSGSAGVRPRMAHAAPGPLYPSSPTPSSTNRLPGSVTSPPHAPSRRRHSSDAQSPYISLRRCR